MNDLSHSYTRSQRAALFRERLSQAMVTRSLNRSSLAELAQVDRSTISLLLSSHQLRLPSGHVVAELAAALGVTTDWLLGLTNDVRAPTEILRESVEVAQTEHMGSDEHIAQWLQETGDAKVRAVPMSLPEFMKTDAVMALECDLNPDKSVAQMQANAARRLAITRLPGRDMEFAVPLQLLQHVAQRSGLWGLLSAERVREQLLRMADLCEELYPSTRLHVFDLRRRFSAAVTVLGQRRAVVYVGSGYLVFNTPEMIRFFTRHFDQLVREADVRSHEVSAWLRALVNEVRAD